MVIAVAQTLVYSHAAAVAVATEASIGPRQTVGRNGTPPPDDWPTYHRDMFRSGYDPAFLPFSTASLNWRSATLDGDVYAEPLIVGTAVIVATEQNSLYELNAATGQIVWHINFGTPVNGGTLPCGDINPSGITSTPAIDVAGGTIFVVAFLESPELHHELFAIDLGTGSVKFQLPIDPSSSNFTVENQQQRAALALSNGYVYVAYGGLDGDCGSYHGWVAATNTNGGGPVISYQVPTGNQGAIWGGGSGPVVDNSGNLLVATGNSQATTNDAADFDFGDSVMKLSPATSPPMAVLDWFAPSNWAQLNADDLDLGSTEPMFLNSSWLFQIGKEGVGYVLDANNLGNFGPPLYSADVCDGGGAYGGLAYSFPYLLVPCDNGLVALKVTLGSTPSFTVLWRGSYEAGPPIIAGNAVWDVDAGGAGDGNAADGMIYAFNLTNGQMIFQDSIGSVPTHFNSLSAGDGRIFVTASRQVLAFLPQPLQLFVTPQAPQDGFGSDSGYPTLLVKVTNPDAVPVSDADVSIYVNGTAICTNVLSSTAGVVSCPFEVLSAGTYYWNGTAQKSGFDSAVATQTTFTFTAGPIVYRIPLVTGWNLISIPLVPASTAIGNVLASQIAGENFTAVWSYQDGKWFGAQLSGGVLTGVGPNPLTTMQDGYGYWIYMTRADNLFVVGSIFRLASATPPSYSLSAGWNLIGFKPQPTVASESVGTYLTSINEDYNSNGVWIYDNPTGTWMRASASHSIPVGEALWVYVTTPATLRP